MIRLVRVLVLPWIGCVVVWGGSFVGALTLHLSGSDDYSWLIRAAILSGGLLFPVMALVFRRRAVQSGAEPAMVSAALLLFALTPFPVVSVMGFG